MSDIGAIFTLFIGINGFIAFFLSYLVVGGAIEYPRLAR